jgi:hypothetical protein
MPRRLGTPIAPQPRQSSTPDARRHRLNTSSASGGHRGAARHLERHLLPERGVHRMPHDDDPPSPSCAAPRRAPPPDLGGRMGAQPRQPHPFSLATPKTPAARPAWRQTVVRCVVSASRLASRCRNVSRSSCRHPRRCRRPQTNRCARQPPLRSQHCALTENGHASAERVWPDRSPLPAHR